MKNNIEVLSPAGDMECLHFALSYGADAVYLGAKMFGMRASSNNFSLEDLYSAATFAHAKNKKIYLTLNTLPTNVEVELLPSFLEEVASTGIDAFIIADLGVLSLAKKHAPDVEVHFSTQAGIANYAAANAAHSLGASRVVLARELSLSDIATVRAKTPAELELEVFVHGAMCMSVSGRCLLSQYLTGRDANRGMCAQSCRWKYHLVEETRPGEFFEIGEGEGGSYILNANDLCAAPFIDKVIDAGVTSLKIEGRAKSFYYVASSTAAYRAAVDAALAAKKGTYIMPNFTSEELSRTSHRPYSPGFFLSKNDAVQNYSTSGYIREWQVLAIVQQQKDSCLYCVQRGKFNLGDELELLMPKGRTVSFIPTAILDEKGKEIEATPHATMKFSIKAPLGAENAGANSILRKKIL